jgi:hypothetical protein
MELSNFQHKQEIFSLLETVQMSTEAHPIYYSQGTARVLSLG